MKNLYVTVGLVLAFMSVGHIWAQDVSSEENDTNRGATVQIKKGKEDGHIKVDVSVDDDNLSDQEALDKIANVVRKVAGDEVADDIIIEVKGMTKEEKAEMAEAIREGIKFNVPDIPKGAVAVAITGIVFLLLSPLLILIAVFIYGARKRRQKMEIIQVYLDSGKDVPPQVLNTFDNSGGSFRSGLMYTAVGLGIIAAFNAGNDSSTGALGLIPLFIGIAKLVYWMVEERKYGRT